MSRWTPKLVCHFMYTRFGVEVCRERARQLLHASGFRLRRLRRRHVRAQPAEQGALATELQALLEDGPEDGDLLFVDEATVRRHPTLTAQWCGADDVPEVPTGDDHPKVHGYGAVAPLTGRTHHHINRTLGREAVARFLRRLRRDDRGKRRLVIHDRAAQQKGGPSDAVLREAKGRLRLKPQPAYSPELNPQERTWKWRRRGVTHNHWFASLREDIHAVRDFFCDLAGCKAQVRHRCAVKTPESLIASL